MKKIILAGVATGLMAFVSNAFAVADGLFFGVQIGTTNTNNKSEIVYPNSYATNLNSYTAKVKNGGFGERFFFGSNLIRYAGYEAGFTHYGNAGYPKNGPCQSNPSAQCALDPGQSAPVVVQNAFDIVGKGIYPFESGFSIFGKLGIGIAHQSKSKKITGPPPFNLEKGDSSTSVRPLLGFGVSYDLSQNWVGELVYSEILSGGNIQKSTMFAFGLSYHFVDKFCGQFLC